MINYIVNKKMNNFISAKILICFFILGLIIPNVFAQTNDNDFQRFYSKSQPLVQKNVEQLSKEDLTSLNNLSALSPNAYGESNAPLITKLITAAKQKKQEYNDYMEAKNRMSKTLDNLDDEQARRAAAELRGDSLYSENSSLKQIIEELQAKVAKFEQQAKKLTAANKKLETENLASKALLQSSSDLVAQMLMLMPNISLDDETRDGLPPSLRDSIESAQCGVAQLLKSNFLITLQQLEANQQFMDTAAAYFRQNGRHTVEVISYTDNCSELVAKLRRSGIECAIGYASDIENEMNNFLMSIENRGEQSNLGDFIVNNIIWIGPVFLIVIIGIILLIRKTSKNGNSNNQNNS
jgi:hypothetical protein